MSKAGLGNLGGVVNKTEELKNNTPNPSGDVGEKTSGAKDAVSGVLGGTKATAENTVSSAHHNLEERSPAMPDKDAFLSGAESHINDASHG